MDILFKDVTPSNFSEKLLKASKSVFDDDQKKIANNILRSQGYQSSGIELQEALEAQYLNLYDNLIDQTYNAVCKHLGMKIYKATNDDVFKIKGKVFFSPKTGKPLTLKQWRSIKYAISKFLGKETDNLAEKMIAEQNSLGSIFERLEKQGVRIEDTQSKTALDKVYDNINDYAKEYNWNNDDLAIAYNQMQRLDDRITNANQDLIQSINNMITSGVSNRESTSEISRKMLDAFAGQNRNWQRITAYESQYAFNSGYGNAELKYNEENENETVYMQIISQPDACKHCKRLHNGKVYILKKSGVSSNTDGDEYAVGTIILGSTNIGVKATDYTAGVPLHPHCRCRMIRWYPEFA